MKQRKDEEHVFRQFSIIKSRQLIATLLALSAVIVLAVVSKRPDLFGSLTKASAMKAQLFIILLFINFTAFNWKCPSCRKYLGSDIKKPTCRKCGVRLQ